MQCPCGGCDWRVRVRSRNQGVDTESLLPQALTPIYENPSPFAQEVSSGEMSDLKSPKKVTIPQASLKS